MIIKLQDIDEAIENLKYKSETTLKSRLIRAIRSYYPDESSPESLPSIDTEQLVISVWETGDDRELIKAKRKNISSIKSSVNSDLKKLYSEGKNPQGIIIGHNNVFDISDEAKDKALSSIVDIFKEKGIDTSSKITEILAAVSDVLSDALTGATAENARGEIDRLKNILSGISEKMGLSLKDIVGLGDATDQGLAAHETSGEQPPSPGASGQDLSGYINEGIQTLDQGLKGLAREVGSTRGILSGDGFPAEINPAFGDIMEILKNGGGDAESKSGKIMAAVHQMLSDALSAAGNSIDGAETQQLKQLFKSLTEKKEALLSAEGSGQATGGTTAIPSITEQVTPGKAADQPGTAADGPEKEIAMPGLADILNDSSLDAQGKVAKMMAAVNEMLAAAMASGGLKLGSDEAEQIKQMIGDLAYKTETLLSAEGYGQAAEGAAAIPSITEQATAGVASDWAGATAGDPEKEMAMPDFADILNDSSLDAKGKIAKMMAAVNEMLAAAIASGGLELSGAEAGQINDRLTGLTENLGSLPAEESGLAAGQGEIIEVTEETTDAGADEVVEVIEEVAGDELTTQTADSLAAGETLSSDALLEEAEGDILAGDGASDALGEAEATDELVEVVEEIVEGPSELAADGQEIPQESLPAEGPAAELTEEAAIEPGDILEAGTDEFIEVIEEVPEGTPALISDGEGTGTGTGTGAGAGTGAQDQAILEAFTEMPPAAANAVIEDMTAGDEIVEIVDDLPAGDIDQSAEMGQAEAPLTEALPDTEAYEEVVEIADTALETDSPITETEAYETVSSADPVEIEEIDKLESEEVIEELIEEGEAGSGAGLQVQPADNVIDAELREKTDLLRELAQAAKALEKLGPDLSGSIYSEEEIRGKAKLLSEEFDRYLSIRDKFYNQHIFIKGGNFLVGGSHMSKNELPEQIVTLPDFYIGKFPVTNALFEIFVEKTGYITTAERYGYGMVYIPQMQRVKDPVSGVERFMWHNQLQRKKIPGACWHKPSGPLSSLYLKRTHPVVQVSLEDAFAFAAWTGKRLPTEQEWEAAARTAHSYFYPWGNDWKDDACNIEKSLQGDTTPVDKYQQHATLSEVADTLGNVLEWTMDKVDGRRADDEGANLYVVKSSSWVSGSDVTLTDRQYIEQNTSSNILGFRCIAI